MINLEMSQGPIYHHYNYCHIITKPTIMKFITSVILETVFCVFLMYQIKRTCGKVDIVRITSAQKIMGMCV